MSAAANPLLAKKAPQRSPLAAGRAIKHTSVYLPEAAREALREVAFDERKASSWP
jgi:hypothetical protein